MECKNASVKVKGSKEAVKGGVGGTRKEVNEHEPDIAAGEEE